MPRNKPAFIRTTLSGAAGLLLLIAAQSCVPRPVVTTSVVPLTSTTSFTYLPDPTHTPTVVVFQATVAPLPTVGPTATPVTYLVQEGDTLIGIAFQHGLTLEELQIVNPGVLPQALQPGQVLVIPSAPAEGGGLLLPAATPAPLNLSPVVCFETPAGSHWCFLEAVNEGAESVENPSALVTLVGSGGSPLVTDVAYSPLNLIPAGSAVPLAVFFPATVSEIAGAGAQVLSAERIPNPESRYLPLVLTQTGVEGGGAQMTISGEVTLQGERAARLVKLVLVLYDAAGQVSGYRELDLPDGLAPGQSVPFRLGANSMAGSVARFRLIAEAQP